MERPWEIGPLGDIVRVELVPPVLAPGDWTAVESHLGVGLPSDYRQLIGDGKACVFDEELFIASPFDARPHTNLLRLIGDASFTLAYLRHQLPESFPVSVFPEPNGMLAWGTDGGGVYYYWDTSQPDPDRWTVFASGRPTPDPGEWHPWSLIGYLDRLRDGSVPASGLGNWPSPDAAIRRWGEND